ncbi:hypothetical protein RA264_28560, partial [Pseudomonas syringae pv. tagetis]|uniref:hypothetical protein n=1 Tax=Pseudomonas syringae group genomosp. 7 TaxID=251699 RepID=UPI00376FC82D
VWFFWCCFGLCLCFVVCVVDFWFCVVWGLGWVGVGGCVVVLGVVVGCLGWWCCCWGLVGFSVWLWFVEFVRGFEGLVIWGVV